ncbi:hypothetical protein [Bythopirellula polymerisocia]|uniref:Secreted protein n=1 Tax=Bythopirellula polymerisocia TaxID=2528003 RepID=A0A5C6CUY8_9BACT|nr:hypothetical protein [Bythopirellula polymerisocia]TWU27241.1 hypothetical protein Pla144_20120 [Bythopirellula polymerisocia]
MHNDKPKTIRLSLFVILSLACFFATAIASAQLSFEPSWYPPSYETVREQVFTWIDSTTADPVLAQEARSLWPSLSLRELDGPAMLDLVVETAAMTNPQIANLMAQCNEQSFEPLPPDLLWLSSSQLPEMVQNNVRLYVARWLTQHTRYDDVLVLLGDLQVEDVVDPASLLFCRMVAHHQVVEPDRSRAALVELLEQAETIPVRYRQVAELVEKDLAGLEDESLDHVSRRMNDVRRRLNLGQAGKQVQVVEKGVVDSLDGLIKKIEEQQQQQSGSGSGSAQSSTPMQDSQLPSLKAPGKVDKKDIGHQAGWGDLPPKEREEAMQQIGREFPAHYRQLIEQYFRDLADEDSKQQKP